MLGHVLGRLPEWRYHVDRMNGVSGFRVGSLSRRTYKRQTVIPFGIALARGMLLQSTAAAQIAGLVFIPELRRRGC
jgi:hypothetical protein